MRKALGVLGLVASLALIGCGGNNKSSDDKPGPSFPSGPGAITPNNTKIEFIGTKPDGKHNGGFKSFSGSIQPPDADITKTTITVQIDTDSLYTDTDPKLGNHLRSPDFFEVKKYPEAKFVSKEIKAEKKDGNTHTITGDLTLHGTTKTITIPAKVGETAETLTLDSSFAIDRTEFGIAYKPAEVDKEVKITVSAKVSRK